MIIGQTLNADGGYDRDYFTPWFPRQADNAVFTYDRIASTLSTAEAVDVFHKNEEDAGAGTMLTGFSADLTSTGLFEAQCIGLKEMVRFRIQGYRVGALPFPAADLVLHGPSMRSAPPLGGLGSGSP